jgi:hypothetical protein
MPNWCSNSLCLQHEDPEMIAKAAKGFNEGGLLSTFIPVPEELNDTISGTVGDPVAQELLEVKSASNLKKYGYANWYDFCVGEWGTKWDVGTEGADADVSDDGRVMSVYFDSAWSPPIAAYEKLQDLGFQVNAYYYESGMCYAGIYDECGDSYYDLSGMDSAEIRDQLPQDLDLAFSISEQMEEWESENEDEVTTWYKEGVESNGLEPHVIKKEKNA